MYFPKRELLSLRVVLALPNASMIGFVAVFFFALHQIAWFCVTLTLSQLAQDLLFDFRHCAVRFFLLAQRLLIIGGREISHDIFCADCFASTAENSGGISLNDNSFLLPCIMYIPFTRDNDRLVHFLVYHASVRILCYRKKMRFQLSTSLSGILLYDIGIIQRNSIEWVDGNEDNARICIYQSLHVACPDGIEHCVSCINIKRCSRLSGMHILLTWRLVQVTQVC